MGLPKRIRGLRTAFLVLLSFFYSTLSDSPNHSHTNPKIVYVSPFSSEPRYQHSASERQENSVIPLAGTGSSDYGLPLPRLRNHDYSNAPIVEDPKYATGEPFDIRVQSPSHVDEPLHVHVQVPEDQQAAYSQPAYGEVTQDTYAQQSEPDIHVQSPTHIDEPLHIHVQVPAEPVPAPDSYGQPAPDTYGVEPALATYEAEAEAPIPQEIPPEPQAAPPAPALGLLQLLPLFVITVLAVIASTIVGAILG